MVFRSPHAATVWAIKMIVNVVATGAPATRRLITVAASLQGASTADDRDEGADPAAEANPHHQTAFPNITGGMTSGGGSGRREGGTRASTGGGGGGGGEKSGSPTWRGIYRRPECGELSEGWAAYHVDVHGGAGRPQRANARPAHCNNSHAAVAVLHRGIACICRKNRRKAVVEENQAGKQLNRVLAGVSARCGGADPLFLQHSAKTAYVTWNDSEREGEH
ncbi:hypothetical protein PMIN01_10189 [Paraphaeosphaeria minitans]|uniref:Uncharacterized protein n=1 Tax=Paraphaeosphaeria minitans TaxID=565426 RepID=A0A9P6GDA1_9PLEO|nr:hypothetical protein PMIN01_10189 [Paraphaeosphaeria minitans]